MNDWEATAILDANLDVGLGIAATGNDVGKWMMNVRYWLFYKSMVTRIIVERRI